MVLWAEFSPGQIPVLSKNCQISIAQIIPLLAPKSHELKEMNNSDEENYQLFNA